MPFPFTERPAAKRRPALVVSTRAFNEDHRQLILAMITSARQSDWTSDTLLADWAATGLAVACRMRLKLFTLPDAMVLRRLGSLSDADRASAAAALRRFLAMG